MFLGDGRERERWEEMREIIMRNWDLSECRMQVNTPFLIQQVLLVIRRIITPVRGLLNPITQVVPGYIISAPIFHIVPICIPDVSFSTIIAEHNVQSSLSISPCHDHQLTLCTAYTKYSIHPRLSVFPSFSQLRVDLWMKLQYSGMPPYMMDRYQPGLHESSQL